MKNTANQPRGLSAQDQEGTLAGREGRLEHWTEAVIKEARDRGGFDHLDGKGRPLRLGEYDPYAGPEADGYRILKEAGFTPEWIALRRQVAQEVAWLRAHPGHPERTSRLVEVNLLIEKHNRLIPNPSLAFPKVPRDFGA